MRGREGGREGWWEDDGTGVEFTHPAGSAHYWHICFSVMSHPSYGGSERKCGFLSEKETQAGIYKGINCLQGCLIVSARNRFWF